VRLFRALAQRKEKTMKKRTRLVALATLGAALLGTVESNAAQDWYYNMGNSRVHATNLPSNWQFETIHNKIT